MRRREFVGLLGAAAAWPLAARAQPRAIPMIGYLRAGGLPIPGLAAFRHGLNDLDYIEGRNVAVEIRNSEQYDRLPSLASELVRRQVAVIFAHNVPAAVAARAATATIPIVFAIGGDPIRDGLVTSLSRPTANLTGVTFFAGELLPKRLELLRELLPSAKIIAVLFNPNNPNLQTRLRDVQEAARLVGQQIRVVNASSESDIDTAFATIVQEQMAALLVGDDPYFGAHREQIIALAARYAIPASWFTGEDVQAGGLMTYTEDRADSLRQAGHYVGRILKGEKTTDLPVLQPTKFEFVINLQTARTLGIEIPPTLLAIADEVIE